MAYEQMCVSSESFCLTLDFICCCAGVGGRFSHVPVLTCSQMHFLRCACRTMSFLLPSLFLNSHLSHTSSPACTHYPPSPWLCSLWSSVYTFIWVSVNHHLELEQPTGSPTQFISLPAAPSLSRPLPLLCHPSPYLCTPALSLLLTYFSANLHSAWLCCLPLIPLPCLYLHFFFCLFCFPPPDEKTSIGKLSTDPFNLCVS